MASGWHFPSQFYQGIASQILPEGWKMDMFCVAHRSPSHALKDKVDHKYVGDRADLDKRLYESIPSFANIESIGWKVLIKPNTIGDWGNSNQWLEDYDYKKYDVILFTHDDNLILSPHWFATIITDGNYDEWEVLCNSSGMPPGWIRGSCEFFKRSFIKKMRGKFDLSKITLKKVGAVSSSDDLTELYDWNNSVEPLMKFIEKHQVKVGYCSPAYRVSAFCIEGERGYIANTHGANTESENKGLEWLKTNGLI